MRHLSVFVQSGAGEAGLRKDTRQADANCQWCAQILDNGHDSPVNGETQSVTYFVNFELNRRFEAAKDALAVLGRDNTERT